jgi:hypothetical protein
VGELQHRHQHTVEPGEFGCHQISGTINPNLLVEASINYDGNIINITNSSLANKPAGWSLNSFFNTGNPYVPGVGGGWGNPYNVGEDMGSAPWHTSAADDDHISKGAFKKGCWDTQIDFIQRFEVERVFGNDAEAFVKYLCHTKNGKSFRNVEYFRVRDGKVECIECYFGGKSTFASAVSKG